MKVSQIMKKEPLALDAQDTLEYAMKRMAEKGQSEAPVIKQRKFAGMLCASRIASLLVKQSLLGKPAASGA
ncbi:MAG: CBS domain-containing protein, partial [Candidatus Micrarchaeia archaeon]